MKVGDHVVCIDDSIDADKLEEIKKDVPFWIKKGIVYTIRAILPNDDIVTSILLEEVINPPLYFKLLGRHQEPGFATWRFRLLNEFKLSELKEVENIDIVTT